MQLPVINAFWIGPQLGPIAIACLHSFVKAGHRVKLHVYTAPSDAPAGIELVDAANLLSPSRIAVHRPSGSHAMTADLFRYEIQAAAQGIYVDCDCYCIRPIEEAEYIMGFEDQSYICNAVLRLPSDSPLLADMRRIGGQKAFVPPWLGRRQRRWYKLRARLGAPVALADMPWGTIGPLALTHFAQRHGVADRASAPDIFYGLPKIYADLLIEPDLTIENFATPRTRVVHLWNEYSKRLIDRAPPGSPIARLIEEGRSVPLA